MTNESELPEQALLPCPFCGSTSICALQGSTYRWVLAECTECGARCGEVRAYDDYSLNNRELVKTWNTRADLAGAGAASSDSALNEIETALISIADGVSPQVAVGKAFNIINRERARVAPPQNNLLLALRDARFCIKDNPDYVHLLKRIDYALKRSGPPSVAAPDGDGNDRLWCNGCRRYLDDEHTCVCQPAPSVAAIAAAVDDPLISLRAAKAAVCYMCAKPERYKPAQPIEGSERLFHFQGSDNWNAGQCAAMMLDKVPTVPSTASVPSAASDCKLETALGYIKRAADRVLPKLPCRVDEMTEREAEIFKIGAEAVGNLQFISRELDALGIVARGSVPSGEVEEQG